MGKKFKDLKRCSVSNKVINGKEVVLVDYALDYVKMQGYVVIGRKKLMEKRILAMSFMLLSFVFLFLSPISAKLIGQQELQQILNNNTYYNNTFNFINQTQNETDLYWSANYTNLLNSCSPNFAVGIFENGTFKCGVIVDSFAGNYSLFLTIYNLTTNNTFLQISNWNATNTSYVTFPILNNGSYFNQFNVNHTDSVLIYGRGTGGLSNNIYWYAGGGASSPNDNDESQLLRMAFNGTLHNLTFILSINQSANDICILYVRYNSTFGTSTSDTPFLANLSGVKQIAINKTESLNVVENSYIKMHFQDQSSGGGGCQGTPSWSFRYEKK